MGLEFRNIWAYQGWGQFRNWNWNWYQFQFQFQELELQRNWIKGIGIGIDKEELKELIQFLFLIVNSFSFFAMFLAESLNQFDLKPFWIQLTRISLDGYIILYDNLSIKSGTSIDGDATLGGVRAICSFAYGSYHVRRDVARERSEISSSWWRHLAHRSATVRLLFQGVFPATISPLNPGKCYRKCQ